MQFVFLLITLTFAFSLIIGSLLEKYLKMPWMFSALFLGILFSLFNLFQKTIETEIFNILSTMGMLFLLFMIGFNLEINQIKKFGRYIVKGTIIIVGLEATIVGVLLFFLFPSQIANSPLVAIVIALSFATVGEAVLLPILVEYNLVKTRLGQIILGIGTLDDVIEVLTLILIPFLPLFLPTLNLKNFPNPIFVIIDLIGIVILTVILMKFAPKIKLFLSNRVTLSYVRPLLILLLFFFFVALGGFVFDSLAAISAIFGGLVTRSLLPVEHFQNDEKVVNFFGYIFLSPIFFLSVGSGLSFSTIYVFPLLLFVILLATFCAKMFGSYLLFHNVLGKKNAALLGLGLNVRFSTGFVVQYVLLISGLITLDLYSALIASAVILTPTILVVLPLVLRRKENNFN